VAGKRGPKSEKNIKKLAVSAHRSQGREALKGGAVIGTDKATELRRGLAWYISVRERL